MHQDHEPGATEPTTGSPLRAPKPHALTTTDAAELLETARHLGLGIPLDVVTVPRDHATVPVYLGEGIRAALQAAAELATALRRVPVVWTVSTTAQPLRELTRRLEDLAHGGTIPAEPKVWPTYQDLAGELQDAHLRIGQLETQIDSLELEIQELEGLVEPNG